MNNKILQIILVILVAILILCVFGEVSYRVNKSEEPKISSVDSLTKVINEKDSLIEDLEFQVDVLEEDISEREAEISYWGRKYDSLRTK
jgi:hypothetical protein